jgi:hypothetical protein
MRYKQLTGKDIRSDIRKNCNTGFGKLLKNALTLGLYSLFSSNKPWSPTQHELIDNTINSKK